jgi:hypothetical protein
VLEPDEAIGQARESNGGARTDEVMDELAVPRSPLLTSAITVSSYVHPCMGNVEVSLPGTCSKI